LSSLKEWAVKGVKWTAVSAVFATVTAPLFQLVKAWYLTPEQWAYLPVLMVIIGLSRNLEAAGFNRGVIQRDKVSTEEASSLLSFNVVISLFAAAVVYLIGAPLAAFYDDLPRLDYFLQIMSLAVFFQGITQFFLVFLEKFFYFRVIAIVQITRQFLFVVLGAFLIIQGWGVLGFVVGHVTATIISAVLFAFEVLRKRVTTLKLYFQLQKIKPFVRFGIFVTGRQTLNVLTRQADELIILHFLGTETTGIYVFGKSLLERLRQLLNMSYYRLVFPLLSRLKHNQSRLSGAYYRMSRYVSMIAFPAFVGVSLTAHLFVPVIFGEQWNDSIIVFQVFSITLILKMLTGILASNLLYSVNRPGTVFGVDLATDLIYITALMVFAPLGINVVIMLYAIYQVIKALAMQLAAHRHLDYHLLHYFSHLKGPAGLSLIMAAAVAGFQYTATPWLEQVLLLAVSIVVGVITYLGLTWVYDQKSVKEIKDMLYYRKVG